MLQYKLNKGCISLLNETVAGKTMGAGVALFFSQLDKPATSPSNKKKTKVRLLTGINTDRFFINKNHCTIKQILNI